jgi:hypothetical protein
VRGKVPLSGAPDLRGNGIGKVDDGGRGVRRTYRGDDVAVEQDDVAIVGDVGKQSDRERQAVSSVCAKQSSNRSGAPPPVASRRRASSRRWTTAI